MRNIISSVTVAVLILINLTTLTAINIPIGECTHINSRTFNSNAEYQYPSKNKTFLENVYRIKDRWTELMY